MKLLLDTQTQKLLQWPRIDDEPVVGLAAHLLEMTVVQEDKPSYDPATQRLEKTEVIDADAQTVTRGWSVVEVPAPTYTADEWVDTQGYDGKRPTTLLYLKLKLDAAQLTAPKLAQVQAWLDDMIVAGVTAPQQTSSEWPVAPWTFEEASGEALGVLAGQNPET